MAINTDEIELYVSSIEKFAGENPRTMAWLLHNFSVIKDGLGTGTTTEDLTELQDAITAMQALLAAIQVAVDAIVLPAPFDPSALQAQIDDLQDQIDAIVIPPPFVLPPGSNGQVLTHGTLPDEVFFATLPSSVTTIYAPAQTGDLIPVNESEADEAILPEFLLDDDGKIMLIPLAA